MGNMMSGSKTHLGTEQRPQFTFGREKITGFRSLFKAVLKIEGINGLIGKQCMFSRMGRFGRLKLL